MGTFKQSGGRLFRIVLIFVAVSIITLGIMAYFTSKAMQDIKEITLTPIETETGVSHVQAPTQFYTQLVDNMRFGTVLSALSGVLIAVAARYGLRETAKSYSEGQGAKSQIKQGGSGETENNAGSSTGSVGGVNL